MPLFFTSGAIIEEINILGTTIKITEPAAIQFFLITIFSYFLIRYWQYYREETYVKDMHQKIHESLYTWEASYLRKKAKEKAYFLEPDSIAVAFADPKYTRYARYSAIPIIESQVTFPFMRRTEIYIHSKDMNRGLSTEEIDDFKNKIQEHKNWVPLVTKDGNATSFYREHIHYSIFRFNIMRAIGIFKFIFNESYFTDYLLPYIVAMASILFTISAAFI
jgi:hypothetical protein